MIEGDFSFYNNGVFFSSQRVKSAENRQKMCMELFESIDVTIVCMKISIAILGVEY